MCKDLKEAVMEYLDAHSGHSGTSLFHSGDPKTLWEYRETRYYNALMNLKELVKEKNNVE